MFSKLEALRLSKKKIKNPKMRLLNEAIEKHRSQIPVEDRIAHQMPLQHEYALFRRAVSDVVPLKNDQANLHLPKPKPRLRDSPIEMDNKPIFSEETQWLNLECAQQLSWVKHGHDPNLVKRLRKGQCELNQRLDLHGMTIAAASYALQSVLQSMQQQHQRYLLVIHGKGNHENSMAVIKAKVNEWLRGYPYVFAFASAPLKWGDTGATVVMLGGFESNFPAPIGSEF